MEQADQFEDRWRKAPMLGGTDKDKLRLGCNVEIFDTFKHSHHARYLKGYIADFLSQFMVFLKRCAKVNRSNEVLNITCQLHLTCDMEI